ncbi:MAG: hypothetical protein ABJG47_12090 [Ekhidna sp.]
MEAFEREYQDECSDFDDRLELEELCIQEKEEESEPLKEEDLFYRHLEEY